jgi:hypothetical protein
MSTLIKLHAAAFLGLAACAALAVEPIDRPDYKIYISSPLEQWSGSASELKASAKSHTAKETSYRIMLRHDHPLMGHPTVFQSPTNHPVIKRSNDRLAEMGFSIPRESSNYFQIEAPIGVVKDEAPAILRAQAQLRKRSVIAQGDPESLQSRSSAKKVAGTIAALGMMIIAADKLGVSTGTSLALGTGAADDVFRTVSRYGTGIAPVSFQVDQLEAYEDIELRRVTSREQERTGQLLILYKKAKTEQLEAAALQDAVVALSGALQTPEQIQASRAKDFSERQEIWRECIESGGCKK